MIGEKRIELLERIAKAAKEYREASKRFDSPAIIRTRTALFAALDELEKLS